MNLQDRISSHEDWKDGMDAFRRGTNQLYEEMSVKLEELKKDIVLMKFTLRQMTVDLDEDLRLKKVKVIPHVLAGSVSDCCGAEALFKIFKDSYEPWDFCPECLDCCDVIDEDDYEEVEDEE